jgi:ABC-type transporter Mla maintaining outer membrane lipid asymmetry permease subunit MlaE
MLSLLARIGRFTLEQLAGMGRMVLFLFSAFAWTFRPPTRIRLIVYHVKSIGVE